MSAALLLSASAVFLIAFVMYNKGVLTGKTLPAFTSWSLFSLITFVNGATYLDLTASWVNTVVLFTDCFTCTVTMIIVLIRLKCKVVVDETDKRIALISLIAVLLWVVSNSAWQGNLLNQVAYTLAFIPTYRNVLKDAKNEPTKPWLMWTFAFVLDIVALKLQPTTQVMDYVSPVICLVYHGGVMVLSLRKPRLA